MARKVFTIAALAASIATGMVPAATMAQDRYGWNGYDHRDDGGYGRGYGRGYDRGYGDRGYGDRGYYAPAGYDRGYYGRRNYGYRCHSDGTTGTIIGAIAGGLIGNGVAGRGDHTLGTLLGGGAGALAGRAIDRSGNRC